MTCYGDGEDDVISHGEVTDQSVIAQVGADEACIYRVEMQGTSQNITAMRYYWFRGSTYQADTFGSYLYGSSTST